ncbi:tyrosine-type recombinase/integrase [Escherichia coli]|nr:tyrosine-type recombinase/integrase [Escherichia coli]
MSDPVRITNPGAESLGYDSDGHEIMAVDIYVNPPRVDVFHGTPPAWSSFGNKTIWGGNEWVDDSPTRSDIEKRDKEITAYKNTLSAQQKENENKRTEAGKRLSAAIAAREKDENTLKTLRAGNADAADITRQEFRLLQAELREYGFRTEIAGYDALRLHTESRMLFADADSLRISPREARSLIEQAEKRQKDAQNADKKAADMLAEYERRKGILDTRLSELEKNGGAALAVLDAQQARLLGQQTRNDRAISEARNKLSSVTESLNTARNALTRAEQQLTQQKNTPDGKTIVSPEKFPGRSSTNHSIVVSGDPRFAGTIKITTSAVIDNRANLNYLLTHSGLDYKRNILNDRNPVVTEDVEGDKKIYNAEVAEWDKLRQRLLDARNKITSAESAVNSARNNLSARTNEQKHANDALNARYVSQLQTMVATLKIPMERRNKRTGRTEKARIWEVTDRTVRTWIGEAVAAAAADGVTFSVPVTPHTFRHSYAMHMLYAGIPLKVLQSLMGHKSISSTEVYTKVFALDVAARHRVQFSMPESDAVSMLKRIP